MIVGIDLGTTNSEVAIWKDGNVVIVEENGDCIMPSCVGINAEGEPVVGREALNQYALRPAQTIRSIKRKMGSSETVELGGQTYRPPEISAMILRKLKQRAESALGGAVSKAVITVPAYFNDAQRQATREAGDLAGLEVLRIVNEPTAAGLAFEAEGVEGTRQVMVFDLGGGTFDVSILKMSGDIVEVLASHGDNHLGGDDVDELLYEHMLSLFYEKHPGSAALSAVAVNRLRLACEQLKVELSSAAAATLAETGLPLDDGEVADFSHEFSRADFEELCGELLRKTLGSVRHVVAQAGLKPGDLDDIVLVGGSTRIPMVVDLLERELGIRPRRDIHPDLAVAFGAGVMAARLAGERSHRILVDVTPYTFGTRAMGMLRGEYCSDLFVPIIKSGTPLPARRGQVFYTNMDGQPEVRVGIYQGDSDDVHDNVLIGGFMIEDLDETAPEGSRVLLNMNLDIDGILKVTAIEQHTGLSKSVVLDDVLAATDQRSLEASRKKINRLLGDDTASSDAEVEPVKDDRDELLQRVEQCRSRLDEEDLADLDEAINDLKAAVDADEEEAAQTAREAIEDILFFAGDSA
jgi:molecular chaperone DnaK (HSP70)